MRRELALGRCGLACCLCSENSHCAGCVSGDCPGQEWCENHRCAQERELPGCFECADFSSCHKGLLQKIKPRGFNLFVKRYGIEHLLDCLERNEAGGVIYHREGIEGDYDAFENVEELIDFIESGRKIECQH